MPTPFVTIAEMVAFLDAPEREDDVAAALAAATSAADRYLNAFPEGIGKLQVTELVEGLGGPRIFPKRRPILSVEACSIDGRAIPARKAMNAGVLRTDGGIFPSGAEVSLTYTAGYDPVPADAVEAVKLFTQALFTAPNFDANLVGENHAGAFSGGFRGEGPGSMPPAVRLGLAPYVWRF